ncbi:MAG: SPOR domain-containing protein [Odoribacteraceae bacterium]|jgi:cell division protein FtsN|nr:SPOR domain-containing protein [Odoribacteraceae bacterium]
MKIIALAILVTVIATSCNSKRKMYAAPFENEEDEVVVVVEDRAQEGPVQTATQSQEAPIRVQQERVTMRYGTSTKRYHVIVGSFSNETNAIKLRDKLNSAGYVSIIMLNESNMNRVSISGFDDEFSAREELRRIRHIFPEYHDAWLLMVR